MQLRLTDLEFKVSSELAGKWRMNLLSDTDEFAEEVRTPMK
jgi:hypothetical protein